MAYTKKDRDCFIEALKLGKGIIEEACKATGVPRRTYYNWLEVHKDFAEQVADVKEIAIDFVEGKLFKQIEDDNITGIIFFLKTIGKKRGYVERQENINRNVDDAIDLSNLTDKELDDYIKYTETLLKSDKGKNTKNG